MKTVDLQFLENANSPEVTIGPRLFLSVPLHSVDEARKWFIKLWNETVIPYIVHAAKEGVQLYGKRG